MGSVSATSSLVLTNCILIFAQFHGLDIVWPSVAIYDYKLNFAYTHDPNKNPTGRKPLLEWPRYDFKHRQILEITNPTATAFHPGAGAEELVIRTNDDRDDAVTYLQHLILNYGGLQQYTPEQISVPRTA